VETDLLVRSVSMGDGAGKRRKHSRWTDEEEVELRRLWGTARDSVVAAMIGKTTKAVREKATSMGLRSEKGLRVGCRSGAVAHPWTYDEDLVLIKNVGHLSIFEMMERLSRRSRVAIERRCYELGFPPTQGTYSRLQIERDTGYDWRQIRRARDAINQTWKRYGLRKYMVTFDQVEAIIEYLKNERRKWSLRYDLDACRSCGTSEDGERHRHSGQGLCKRCWDLRRHARKNIVSAISNGRAVLLTEEVWRAYIFDGEDLPTLVLAL